MFLATINKSKQLLVMSFIAEVRVEDLAQSHDEVALMIDELNSDFRLLTDLTRLDSMGVECGNEIGRIMELCDQKGVKLVIRVIPDPTKDIGLSILALFHYKHPPRTVTCQSFVEAAKLLSD